MALIVIVTRDLDFGGRVRALASQRGFEGIVCDFDALAVLDPVLSGRVVVTDLVIQPDELGVLRRLSGALAVLASREAVESQGFVRQSLRESCQPDGVLERGWSDEAFWVEFERVSKVLGDRLSRQRAADRVRQDVVAMVDSLAQVLEVRDPYTAGHSIRVAAFSLVVARGLGLDERQMAILEHGAALHDVGKIAIRREVLNKGGVLTDDEFEHIKMHPVIAREILEPVAEFAPVLEVVYHHHERIDGRGYPSGLKGDEIPLLAQIVAVADTFDAMTSDRPYRAGMPAMKALRLMEEVSGTQLNGELVRILAEHVRGTARHSA